MVNDDPQIRLALGQFGEAERMVRATRSRSISGDR
jgi:hypothetical protein